MIKIPPYLKKGDTIGITCPAGFMLKEKAAACIDTLQQWGFDVMVGNTLGSRSDNYFSATDEERRDELQAMLDDDSIKAILCARGGYGTVRIIDQLDFTGFKKKPKWVIGYSDITVLHAHIYSRYKIASMHAPMAAAFNNDPLKNVYITSLHQAITGEKAYYQCAPHQFNKPGTIATPLIGGNLSLLINLIATASDINTKKKLLFIEDIGEYIYGVDRMMYQLKRSGKLDGLAGLIIGRFTDTRDTERPFGKTVDEVINDMVKSYEFPICFNFPVSHEKENYALKIGVSYHFTVAENLVTLTEL